MRLKKTFHKTYSSLWTSQADVGLLLIRLTPWMPSDWKSEFDSSGKKLSRTDLRLGVMTCSVTLSLRHTSLYDVTHHAMTSQSDAQSSSHDTQWCQNNDDKKIFRLRFLRSKNFRFSKNFCSNWKKNFVLKFEFQNLPKFIFCWFHFPRLSWNKGIPSSMAQ